MVLKTAILAERFAPNMRWYVDTVLQVRERREAPAGPGRHSMWRVRDLVLPSLCTSSSPLPHQLINLAGDYVSDDIWHRVVQIVTNHEDLQKYAASKMFHALEPTTAHETAVKVCCGSVSCAHLPRCDAPPPPPLFRETLFRSGATFLASLASC
jgi:AP-2 complex subunit alpha